MKPSKETLEKEIESARKELRVAETIVQDFVIRGTEHYRGLIAKVLEQAIEDLYGTHGGTDEAGEVFDLGLSAAKARVMEILK